MKRTLCSDLLWERAEAAHAGGITTRSAASLWWENRVRTALGEKEIASVFSGDAAVCCKTCWLDFTQARKLASSNDIRVGKLCIVAFLLLPGGLHSVCLVLAYLAKQRYNLYVEDLGGFWQPCQTVHVIPAPLVAQVLLGSAVLGACVWSSPDSLGLLQGGDHGCLPAAKANASGSHLSCFQAHHAKRRSQGMSVFVYWRLMFSIRTLASKSHWNLQHSFEFVKMGLACLQSIKNTQQRAKFRVSPPWTLILTPIKNFIQ